MSLAFRQQQASITGHYDTGNGSMKVEAIARGSGVLPYRDSSGTRYELVHPDFIRSRNDSGMPWIAQLGGAPATNEHPQGLIRFDEQARKRVEVGSVEPEVHIFKDAKGETLVRARMDVMDPRTQDEIASGEKAGVSMGYYCAVHADSGEYNGQKYTHRQAEPLTVDHLAIVARPRYDGASIIRFDSFEAEDCRWCDAPEFNPHFDMDAAMEDDKELYDFMLHTGQLIKVNRRLWLDLRREGLGKGEKKACGCGS